jgi:hypothetical protein
LQKLKDYSKGISKKDGKIIRDENEEIIKITWSDYNKFVQLSGGYNQIAIILAFCVIFYISEMAIVYQIGIWA